MIEKTLDILQCGVPSRKGYIVPLDEMTKATSALMPRIDRGMLRGELCPSRDRPLEINESNVSHEIVGLEIGEDGMVKGRIRTVGPKAADLEKILASDGVVLRPRFVAQTLRAEQGHMAFTNVQIVTFDMVNPDTAA
jgi:hypothetical protein